MDLSLAALSTVWAFHIGLFETNWDYSRDFCRGDCSFHVGSRSYLAAESLGRSHLLNLGRNFDDLVN